MVGWLVTLECRGRGALGDSDSSAASASNWSGSALSPRMRKKPAMVAERKMRITRSGHISCCCLLRARVPRCSPDQGIEQSTNQSIWRGGRETGFRKGGAFGFTAPVWASGDVEKRIKGRAMADWGRRRSRLVGGGGFLLTFSRGGARRRPPNAFSPPQLPSNKLTIESTRNRNGGRKNKLRNGNARSGGGRASS